MARSGAGQNWRRKPGRYVLFVAFQWVPVGSSRDQWGQPSFPSQNSHTRIQSKDSNTIYENGEMCLCRIRPGCTHFKPRSL